MTHRWGAWPGEDPLVGEVVIDSHPKAQTYGRTAVIKDRRSHLYLLGFPDGSEGWRSSLQVRRMPGKLGWRSMGENPEEELSDPPPDPEKMQSCYFDPETKAIADLVDYYNLGMMITRLNVPKGERGKGAGRRLLNKILQEADRTKTHLFLEIVPSGGLTHEQLREWYSRYGFRNWHGIMRRRPRWRSMAENPDAISELTEGAFVNPLYEQEWIFMDEETPLAGVVMTQVNPEKLRNRVYIAELRALSKGGGRKAMELITGRADKLGISLELMPVPRRAGYYLKPMTLRKLVAWYKTFGFELQGRMRDGYMIRWPKTNP